MLNPHNLDSDTQCPDPAVIDQFLAGRLPYERFQWADRHLSDCDQCRGLVETMSIPVDDVARRLADEGDLRHLAEPELADALLKCVTPEEGKIANDETETPPVDRVGPYQLLRRLGRGGMASVYLSRHEHLDRLCALKLLPLSGHRDHLDRFRREMKSLAAVDHPNVVAATDAGDDPPWHYLVMQYIDGVDLSQIIDHAGTLDVASACAIASSVANALAALHDAGLIHRDIKPSNIMLTRDGTVKLLDFGLAGETADRIADADRLTTVGQVVGTITYASPEQLAGEKLDTRSDIYSLGVTLYRMIAGHHPHASHDRASLVEVLHAKTVRDPSPLADSRGDVDDELSQLVASMLHRDRSDRVASAAEVATRIHRFADSSNLPMWVKQTSEDKSVVAPAWPKPRAAMGHGGRRWRGWIAAGGFLSAALLGYVISIQTDEGTLVIRSDREITVELTPIADGPPSKTLTVKQGDNQTVIRSGRYQIVATPPADDIELKPSSVVISDDAVAVVTATQRKLDETDNRFGLTPAELRMTFEGSTIAEHINTIANDLSVDAIARSTRAILPVLQSDNVALAQFLLSPSRRYGGYVMDDHSSDPSRRYMGLVFEEGGGFSGEGLPRVDLDRQLLSKVGIAPFMKEFEEGSERSRAAVLWTLLSNSLELSDVNRDAWVSLLDQYQKLQERYQPVGFVDDNGTVPLTQITQWNVRTARQKLLSFIIDGKLPWDRFTDAANFVGDELSGHDKAEKSLSPEFRELLASFEQNLEPSLLKQKSMLYAFRLGKDFEDAKSRLRYPQPDVYLAAAEIVDKVPTIFILDQFLDNRNSVERSQEAIAKWLQRSSSDESGSRNERFSPSDAFVMVAAIHSRPEMSEKLGILESDLRTGKDGIPLVDDWIRPGVTPAWLASLDEFARQTGYPITLGYVLDLQRSRLKTLPPDYLPPIFTTGQGTFGFGGGQSIEGNYRYRTIQSFTAAGEPTTNAGGMIEAIESALAILDQRIDAIP